MAKPTKFEDLDKKELYRSAVEDFAIDVTEEEKNSKKLLLAAFAENSIFWDDYVNQHPDVAPDEPVEVVKSNAPSHGIVGEDTVTGYLTPEPVEEEEGSPVVHVAQPAVMGAPNDQYLIKMVRENPLYQTRGYEFTQEHPYALVRAVDAEWILENEDGFRQALPSELAEFYG